MLACRSTVKLHIIPLPVPSTLFLSVALFFLASIVHAQTPDLLIDTKASGAVTVCDDTISFTVAIANQSGDTIENVRLYPQMPAGMQYVAGSLQGAVSEAGVGAGLFFSLDNLYMGEADTIVFRARAGCDLVSYIRSNGLPNLVNNTTKVTYSLNGVSSELLEPNGSESYSVKYPQLELIMADEDKNISVELLNLVKTRKIIIRNSGLGRLATLDFYLKPDAELTVSKLVLAGLSDSVELASSGSGALGMQYTLSDFTGIGDGDNFFEQDETITLVEYVKATAAKTSIQTMYSVYWGCDNQVCNEDDLQASFLAYIQAIGGRPAIQEAFQVERKTDFCIDDPAIVQYTYTNNGSGNSPRTKDTAFNVRWLYTENFFETDYDHHFYLKKTDGTLVSVDHLVAFSQSGGQRQFTIDFNNAFAEDRDGEGGFDDVDQDGFFDDLPPTATVTFILHLKYGMTTEVSSFQSVVQASCYGWMHYNQWSGTAGYQDTTYPRYLFRIEYLDQYLMGINDLTDGTAATGKYEFSHIFSSSIIHQDNSTFGIDIRLPEGVSLNDIRLGNRSLPFTQNDTLVTVLDPLNSYPSAYALDFNLQLDCSQAEGIPADQVGIDVYYYSDHACPGARFKLATIYKNVFLHCETCSSLETTGFIAERKTLGWVPASTSHYKYGDIFGPTPRASKVTSSTPGIRLDAAYPKDEVEAVVNGRVAASSSSLDNISAEISYGSPSGHEMYQYASAVFVVGGVEYPLPSSVQPSVTSAGNTWTYTFNIPLGGSLPSQLTPGATFDFRVKYTVAAVAGLAAGKYRLTEFRGGFFFMQDGARVNCQNFGDDFTIIKPQDTGFQNISYRLGTDNQIFVAYFNNPKSNAQDFPNEFRPLYYINNYVLTMPAGYIFDTSQPVQLYLNGQSAYTGAVFSADKRTITLPLTENTPLINAPSWFVKAYTKPDCNNPANLFVPVTTPLDLRHQTGTMNASMFAYLPSTAGHVTSLPVNVNMPMYNSRRPNLQLTSNSQQVGFDNTISWPVQVCNPYAFYFSDSPNTWLAIELKDNDTRTVLLGASGSNVTPLDTIFYGMKDADHPLGRNMLLKLGTVNLSTCAELNIIAAYKNCAEDSVQEVNSYVGWDYNGYPDVTDYQGSITERKPSCESNMLAETMSVKYKSAALQWTVNKNGPDRVNLCVPVPFDIDLTSTKYGDMQEVKLWMELPDHVALDASVAPMYSYPVNAAPVPIPEQARITEGNRQGWDIASIIGGNLPGTRVTANKIGFNFNLAASCGFDQGIPVKFTVTGVTNCGDPVEFTDQRKIKLLGFVLDELELNLTSAQSVACQAGAESELQLKVINRGLQPSGVNGLELLLPPGVSFNEMRSGDLQAPVVNESDNQVKLTWSLPAGYLAAAHEKSVSLAVTVDEVIAGTSALLFKARTVQDGEAVCQDDNSTCPSQGTSGSAELSIPLGKIHGSNLAIRYSRLVCAYQFRNVVNQADSCGAFTYHWDFGDGTTSTAIRPVHSFASAGTYTITLTANYRCGPCGVQTTTKDTTITITDLPVEYEDIAIQVETDYREQVLSASVSTFSDSWTVEHTNATVSNAPGLLNGAEGVWRNEGAFVYDVDRQQSTPLDISKDGTFTLEQFNWEMEEFNAVPHWTRANTITKYSPFSYEIENRDVLGIYSSALYDYGGHLVSATGANMRNREMAFTSFEYLDKKSSGNWMFGTEREPSFSYVEVYGATGSVAIVKARVEDIEDAISVDVLAVNIAGFPRYWKTLRNNQIICVQPYGSNPDWSLVVLQNAPFTGAWKGYLNFRFQSRPVISAYIGNTIAHSGGSSLQITEDKTFPQPLLQLDSGKTYLISAWVSVNNEHVTTPKLADYIGFDVIFRDEENEAVDTITFEPAGPVIKGWQQINGRFVCPVKNAQVELRFRSGSTGIAWYDDLRLHPEDGNMRSYVYDLKDYRLQAVLDEQNFASFFYYDQEGNLYLTKKETVEGIKTISENISHQAEN